MNVGMKPSGLSLTALLVIFTATRDSSADNGKIALARPVTKITVDGDFTDWPSSLPWNSIDLPLSGELPQDAADFDAAFRVGYDENALYVAVEVRDDSIIAEGKNWWMEQDSCSIYLDVGHTGDRTAPIQYNIFGDRLPRSASGLAVAWSYRRDGTHHRYEWRFDIARIHRPPVRLAPGLVVGLGFIISERDEADKLSYSSRFAWGRGVRKDTSSQRLGDILLVASDEKTGKVHGRLVDEGTSPLRCRAVRLQCPNQLSPVTVASDGQGEFDVVLPVGEYRVFTTSGEEISRVRVEECTTAPRLEVRVPAAIARPTVAAIKTVVTAGRGNRDGRLHCFGLDDGLPGGELRGVTQTADGALWIASEQAGLLRFDGRSITFFDSPKSQPHLSCKVVAADHRDRVWVTADQGEEPGKLLRIDGESFVQFGEEHRANRLQRPHLLIDQIVTDTYEQHWIRDRFGIYRYDEGSFTQIYEKPPSSRMYAMAIESASRVWVGATYGLVRLDAADDSEPAGRWRETRVDVADGRPGGEPVVVRALLIDASKRLWIGIDGGLCRYEDGSFECWTEGLGKARIVALAESDDGSIWVGTDDGLVEFRDGEFTHVAGTGPLNDLFVDREQSIWIVGRGLLRYERQPMSRPMRSELASLPASRLLQTRDGSLWLTTERDVVHYTDEVAKHYTTSDGFVGGRVTSLFEDSRGGVWIGASRGVSHFDGKRFASLTDGDVLGVASVNAITEDATGRIWMGTGDGVAIYDPRPTRGGDASDTAETDGATLTGYVSRLSTFDGLQSDEVNALLADSGGGVWVGTPLGVCRWRQNAVEQFDAPKGVACFLQDDSGDLWAGGDGLYRFDGTRWNPITPAGKAKVHGLAHDPAGHIWMATAVGLKLYDGFAVQTLTSSDGALDSCWDVLWNRRQNSVLVAGERVVTYLPRATAPPVAVTQVATDNELGSVAEVRFASSQPFVLFAFHGISFKTRPDAMLYRFRLRGFEDDWRLTASTQVSYGRLPPGPYTFEVAAIDRDLNYSDTLASVQVRVEREYGQLALWFSLGCALVAVGCLSATVVKRNRRVRRLNVELEQRVKDRTSKLETEMAENKRLHGQLLQSQKLEAVGTMAAGIAHDFNNSLAAITGFAEVAKTSSSNSPELVDHILTAARHAAGTTRNLLTFSKESRGEKVPRDMIELVRETSGFLRKILPRSIQLSTSLPEGPTIWCCIDNVHIQQVLLNVTVNARDALPDGGEISISAGKHSTRPGFALVTIADNGMGMPPEVLDRVFDPFYTTKSRGRGTGLGMAIVHGVIEDHEGTIEIESSVGKGTTVSIALPRCGPAESEPESPEPDLEGRGETILVAEDNLEVRTMLETQLKSLGFRVVSVEDGLKALRVLREQESLGERESKIQLAILDIDLPKKDGLACLQEIDAQFPELPTIMISGLSSVDPTQLSTPFLRKPFYRRELLATIRGALRTRSAGQANGVLVIDDDDLVRLSTEALLVSNDFNVFLAQDGLEAVALLRKNVDRIGAVLLDWNIPQVDPVSTLRELRGVSTAVRVFAVSGDLSLESKEVRAQGFSELLRKPMSAEDLVEALGPVRRRNA